MPGLMTRIRDALDAGEAQLPEHLEEKVRAAASFTRGPLYALERIRRELEMISDEDMAKMGPEAFTELYDLSGIVRALLLGRTRAGKVVQWNRGQ